MTLHRSDNPIYQKLVTDFGSTKSPSTNKNHLLAKATQTLNRLVVDHTDGPNKESKLRKLCEFVQEKVMFLPLEVGNESEGILSIRHH